MAALSELFFLATTDFKALASIFDSVAGKGKKSKDNAAGVLKEKVCR